ncbi:MAG: class I SAM-dependent methyltransferase [Armatimonadota bacterium]
MCEHDPDVLAAIQARMADAGRLTFAEVMEVALYHPTGGYYTAHVNLGPAGDFVTAPEEHPAFGALLARQLEGCWTALGRPAAFLVVEMGGGRGTLAADLLNYARAELPELFSAIRYLLIDRSPRLLAIQHERLQPFGDQVSWAPELPPDLEGVLLSNELVDAFPVHRVIGRPEGLRELYVTPHCSAETATAFEWEEGPPSTPELDAYFTRVDVTLAEGQAAEVNLAAVDWLRAVSRSLRRGFVITIDFGHVARELFRPERTGGTLLAYRDQRVSDDLLACLGRQDLIAHVDFSALVRVGREAGLDALGLVTQQQFLLNLGVEGWLAALDARGLPPAERAANRRALLALLSTELNGLGDAKVLVQTRGVTGTLDGLTPAARRANAARLRELPMPVISGDTRLI